MATTYTAPEQQELLNIIKQLRDYIANSDIAPEDSDRLYQEHLALADSALSHCAECGECTHGRKIRSVWNNTLCEECGDDEEEDSVLDDAVKLMTLGLRVLKGEIAFPFDNNEGDEEEDDTDAIRCFQCERVLKGEIAFPFDNNEGDEEEEDEDICYMCEACQLDPDYISSQEPEELEKHRAKMHTFERVVVKDEEEEDICYMCEAHRQGCRCARFHAQRWGCLN